MTTTTFTSVDKDFSAMRRAVLLTDAILAWAQFHDETIARDDACHLLDMLADAVAAAADAAEGD